MEKEILKIVTKSEASRRLSSFGERRNTGSQLLMFPSLLGYMNLHNSSIFQFLFLSLDVILFIITLFLYPSPFNLTWLGSLGGGSRHRYTYSPIPSTSFLFGNAYPWKYMCIHTHTHTHTYTLTYTHTLLSAPPYCPLGRSVNFSPVETRWVSLSNSVVQY